MTARFLCVGTHHKTGTVWMRRTFHKFAESEGIPVIRVNRKTRAADLPATNPALIVNWSSEFSRSLFDHPDARFLHMIRDPRDVLLSGYRYHLTAPTGNEKFLRIPRPDLGGLTYKEHLNSRPDLVSGLLFEMEGKHAETLAEMLAWPYGHPHVVDLRYEDMIDDTDCALFRAALARMDVAGFDAERLTGFYWTHSLFGGLADRSNRKANVTKHVRSGKSEQWRSKLPREVAEIYAERFGSALGLLGYALTDDWVDACPLAADMAAGALTG